MNEPPNPTPCEALEAKVTALLLGELSPAEEAEVRQALETDTALRQLHDQLARTTALLKEAALPARSLAENPGPPRRLSEDRRHRLLERFRIVVPVAFAQPNHGQTAWLVPMSIAAALVLLLGVAALAPPLARAKSKAQIVALRHQALVNDLSSESLSRPGRPSVIGGAPSAAAASPEVQERLAENVPSSTVYFSGALPAEAQRSKEQVPMPADVAAKADAYRIRVPAPPQSSAQSSVDRAELERAEAKGEAQLMRRYALALSAPAPRSGSAADGDALAINGPASDDRAAAGGGRGGGFGGGAGGAGGGVAQGAAPGQSQAPAAAASYGFFVGRDESRKDFSSATPLPPRSAAENEEAARAYEAAQTEFKQRGLERSESLFREGDQNRWDFSAGGRLLGERERRDLGFQVQPGTRTDSLQRQAGQPPTVADNLLFDFGSDTLRRTGLPAVEPKQTEVLGKKLADSKEQLVEVKPAELNQALAFAVPIQEPVQVTPLAESPPTEGAVPFVAAKLAEPPLQAPVLGDQPALGQQFEKFAALPALEGLKDESEARSPQKAPALQPGATKSTPALEQGVTAGVIVTGTSLASTDASNKLAGLEALKQKSWADADSEAAILLRSSSVVHQPEVLSRDNAFSTFSLNVADVSFKLAAASLEQGQLPDPAAIRVEEFINALDYRDPEPPPGARVGFVWERARSPFEHNRDLIRFSVKTAAVGRQPGWPLNLVLLLDNSGSMERADRVRILRQALEVLARQLTPEDRVSVVAFARTARLWIDGMAGGNAEELLARVGDLTPQGGTNLEDALNLAYEVALRHAHGQSINRVVLLTDGAANLGDVNPDSLRAKVEAHRKRGVALDCFGVGWEGYNDDLLEVLARHGDGRYGFLNTPEEAATEFAGQLAGALRVAAADVKAQVEFNPRRVTAWRQIGYAKHQLKKEQFRDNTVDAAEIGGAEAGNALYTLQIDPTGQGPIGFVRVRFRVPATGAYEEQEWLVPYLGTAPRLEESSPAMRLAATAASFGEWLAGSPFAAEVSPDALLNLSRGVPSVFAPDPRPERLVAMIGQAKALKR